MKLRDKLLWAQIPLALALLLLGVLGVNTLGRLGRAGQEILADNYRSVLAMQRIIEHLERLDSASLFIVAGERQRGLEQVNAHVQPLEMELKVQEGNITEPGEGEATRRLREAWKRYRSGFESFLAMDSSERARAAYFDTLAPEFQEAKAATQEILALNQDAMVRKSDALQRQSRRVNTLMVTAVVVALVGGLLASASLTQRTLRPVSVLSQAVQRLGQGDLAARAVVEGRDEIAQLARDFNAMAEALQRYRQSSLGELLQAQSSSQAAIDSLPDPVVVFGVDGGVLNVNRAAEEVLRLSLEGGGGPLGQVAPEVREVLERVRAHVLGGKGPYLPRGYEEAVRAESAEGDRWLLPRGSPVYGEGGGVVGATVLLQDVTRLRRFDELKNDLVATVAHEFRTPLTSLRMAIHLCVEGVAGPITEKQADLLYAAREDCERLQGIVDDLLDLSKLQAGRMVLEVRPVSSEAVLEAALAPHRVAADERGVRLSSELEPGLEQVEADPERLQLVLSNLVANAVRHTSHGGDVKVSARRDGERVRFEVADTGEGIAPEHQHRIFEKFYRVPGASTGGAGLGLSIAQEIVQAHGGEMGLASEPGLGSTFWFTLPQEGEQARERPEIGPAT
ncbi:ATP-binding protein [Vitiosangium sp. GDMCC 1.1324]|uniref:sensor histidine kinase n=1 Tax=Vitiosangium sp. (strain GDMCC 1.1324) TaxID=2138576 RepID=UPI000D38E3E4|nr:ATP-binding protein [Vitiosangium sp. GDMCC 1.1324]PTL84920.1 PAS domain-containing sensor histidine kinase [Vitiosangium sp. GDMCC 1.1324]